MTAIIATALFEATIEAIKHKAQRLSILSLMSTTAAGSGHPTSCISNGAVRSIVPAPGPRPAFGLRGPLAERNVFQNVPTTRFFSMPTAAEDPRKCLRRLAELVGLELLSGVDNTQVIDSFACQKA